jgi:hypothetical protein
MKRELMGEKRKEERRIKRRRTKRKKLGKGEELAVQGKRRR